MFLTNKREYYTLVSEFMLQQTQVATVIPYFNRFIKNIPNLNALAKINESKLLNYWEGLGYYSRVRNLKKTAQIFIKNFKGRLPDNLMNLNYYQALEIIQQVQLWQLLLTNHLFHWMEILKEY